MSDSAIRAPLGEIMAKLAPQLAQRSLLPAEGLEEACRDAAVGTILAGDESYVLYADVLGFRKQLNTDPVDLEKRLETALLLTNSAIMSRTPGLVTTYPDGTTAQEPIVGLTMVNPAAVFSDSIFIVARNSSPEALRQLVHIASVAFVNFFSNGLPLRGAIAKGRTWWNRNTDVRLGPGITRAFDLAESLDSVGIAIDANIDPPSNASRPIKIPLKSPPWLMKYATLPTPLQLQRNSLSMAHNPSLFAQFRNFSTRPENAMNRVLRRRYKRSLPVIEAMSADPVSA